MALKISLDTASNRRLRRPTLEELKEYLKSKTVKELVEEYLLQTDYENAMKDIKHYLVEWILDYGIHWELYPDKFMVVKDE